jgi:hypothetical protein
MAVRHLGLVQDQDDRLAARGRPLQDFPREGLHDLVADHQGVAEQTRDPLVAHVGSISLPRQPGGQFHQIGAANVEHRRN